MANAAAKPPSPSVVRATWDSLWPLVLGVAMAYVAWRFLPKAIGPYYTRVLLDVGVAMMLAVSLNVVNGLTGQFSMGHAGFMTLGGYTAAAITYYTSLAAWDSLAKHGGAFGSGEWLFAGACLAGGLVAALAGYLVGQPALRLRGDYLAIATLGFGEIVRVVLQQTNPTLDDWAAVKAAPWSKIIPPPVGGSLGFSSVPKYSNLFWVYAFLAITVVALYRLKRSSLGRAMMAIREDEIAAQAMGVNLTQRKVGAFVIAGFFAGVAGGLYAHQSGFDISPNDAGFQRSFDLIIMTVLGGQGSISGVMIAAAALTILPEALRDFEQYRLIVYSLLLIFMMLVRPGGLCGVREIWELLPLGMSSLRTSANEANAGKEAR